MSVAKSERVNARLRRCPSCGSDDPKMTLHATGILLSGSTYARMGWMCLHGWHDYPYLVRQKSRHYGTRKKTKGA